MADYSFYAGEYLGCRIPQGKFDACMARARESLACLERRYQVTGGPEERKLALCAMAEAIYDFGRRQGVSAATAGSVTVRYESAGHRQLWRELYDAACIYLEVSRGVAGC